MPFRTEVDNLKEAISTLRVGGALTFLFSRVPGTVELTIRIDVDSVSIHGCCFDIEPDEDQIASLYCALWAWRIVNAAKKREDACVDRH